VSILDAGHNRAALVWLGLGALALGGVVVARSMPSGIYPEVDFPRIVVVARQGDAPAAEVQRAIVRPLENALATVLGVERIRSRTIRGATEMALQFAPGTDMWRALQLTESRIGEARVDLPRDAEIFVERLNTTSFPVVTFNLAGPIDPRRLRELGEFVLRPALSRERGVGRIEVLGGDVREVEVILDLDRLAALHLRAADVAERIRSAGILKSVGRLSQNHDLVTILVSGEPRSLEELRMIPMATAADGGAIPLGSLARVEEGAEDRRLTVGGPEGETVLISVSRLPGASTPDVVARVKTVADQISHAFPRGVTLTPVYDQAALVEESVRSVRDAILIGVALCIVVISLFLRDARAGFIAALTIPLTLGGTFVFMRAFDVSLNLMSLGGLAVSIGLVIDDAIVVVEAIGRRLESGATPRDAAREGTRALAAAIVGTTATTVIVFVPLTQLEGVVGRFFGALAVTLSSAVLLSMVVALLAVPIGAARWLLPRAPVARLRQPSAAYTRTLTFMLRHPTLGIGAVFVLAVAGIVGARNVPTGFLPTMDEGAFVLDYFLPSGTTLEDTDAAARKIEAVLKRTPEVATYSRRTGAELGPVAATLVSRGDIMVRLRPRRDRRRNSEAVIAEVRHHVAAEVPEVRAEYIQVLQDVLNDLAGTPRPIEIKIFGDDYVTLRSKAAEVVTRIGGTPGLVDLYRGFESGAPELRFRVDAAAAGRFGRTAQDLAADLEASLRGVEAGIFRRPDRPIGIRVRYPDDVRFNPERIGTLPLAYGADIPVPISALATQERTLIDTVLVRESLRPVVIVTADHEGRDLGGVAADVAARLSGLTLPAGYSMEFGGQIAGQKQTFRDLGTVMGFGLLAVLVVLVAQLRRVRLALLVLLMAPLALVGAVVTLWGTGVPLNASALMGCVLLVGLVVKNGILLLEESERQRAAGLSVKDALINAGGLRLRPILMTTVATVAGLAPLALGVGAGAEVQRPLAVAVTGGLLLSTVATLLVLPALVRLTAGSR
jgi:CzcA family heavy metal efflux pump